MIKYIKGDATVPINNGNNLVFHVCNDLGKWGAGFTGAISKKWKTPEIVYRAWADAGEFTATEGNGLFPPVVMRGERLPEDDRIYKFGLGNLQIVFISNNFCIVNAVAQHGIRNYKVNPTSVHIDYMALEECLIHTYLICKKYNYIINMPKIGCGHAGGDWNTVSEIINRVFHDIDVLVYEI